jgi:hypothetical protein
VRLDAFASADPAEPYAPQSLKPLGARRASPSSAHTYRLLIFKDRFAQPRRTGKHHPAPLRQTPLHLQQRKKIMQTLFNFVNYVFAFA